MSSKEDIRVGVTVAAPGNDSNDYVLFDSTAATPPMDMATWGIDRITFALNNSAGGTIKVNNLRAGTTATWDTNASATLTAGAGITGSPYDFVIIGLGPVQLVWSNGGTAQTNWPPQVTLVRGQKASSV